MYISCTETAPYHNLSDSSVSLSVTADCVNVTNQIGMREPIKGIEQSFFRLLHRGEEEESSHIQCSFCEIASLIV